MDEVAYLQSQDGNMYSATPEIESEFKALLTDVPSQLAFCTEAFDGRYAVKQVRIQR